MHESVSQPWPGRAACGLTEVMGGKMLLAEVRPECQMDDLSVCWERERDSAGSGQGCQALPVWLRWCVAGVIDTIVLSPLCLSNVAAMANKAINVMCLRELNSRRQK